jgi:hypothetical protein
MDPKELQAAIEKNERILDESDRPEILEQAKRHLESLKAELKPEAKPEPEPKLELKADPEKKPTPRKKKGGE